MHDRVGVLRYSGTTAICATFFGSEVYIANIGDSRAIIAERQGKRIVAFPLSVDQTPYRRDERERVKACGAMIMTNEMAEGAVKYVEGWEDSMMNDELDGSGDPPRIFAPGMLEPGCSFTRSIGDRAGMHLGVTAEAELLHKRLKETDQASMLGLPWPSMAFHRPSTGLPWPSTAFHRPSTGLP